MAFMEEDSTSKNECELLDSNSARGDDDDQSDGDQVESNKLDMDHRTMDSGKTRKTSFLVDDILSPSKFNGPLANALGAECFMQWQPWLVREAMRQNCPFSNLTFSLYKPFLSNQSTDCKWLILIFLEND